MTIWIFWELPLFNIEHLDILCAWIWHPCEKVWPFDFSRASVVQFLASRYIMRLNLTSVWKVMTIWISRELPLSIFERLDILCAWIWPPCENLWPSDFSGAYVVQFLASRYIMRLNRTYEWKVMTIWISQELSLFNFERLDILCAWIGPPFEKLWLFEFLESFHCSIASISIFDAPESDLRVKSNDHLNFSRPSVVQFGAS